MAEREPNSGNHMFGGGDGILREVPMADGSVKRFRVVDANSHPAFQSGVVNRRGEFHAPPKSA